MGIKDKLSQRIKTATLALAAVACFLPLFADALPGEYRYRLLLTQSGQRSKDFQGSLQFVVNLQQDNKKKRQENYNFFHGCSISFLTLLT